MIGFNRTIETVFVVLMVVFGLLLIALQVARYVRIPKMTPLEKNLWIAELLTGLCLIGTVVGNFLLYIHYIPYNSPGCLKHTSDYGVIASGVEIGNYAQSDATFAAVTYEDAIAAYRKSPNGFATGYFSWDGLAVTILNSNAHELKTGAKAGTSWVFQDLTTAAEGRE